MTMYQRIVDALKDRVSDEYLAVDLSLKDMCIEIWADSVLGDWEASLFDQCSDKDCRDFLLAFLHGRSNINKIGFSTSFELAKLLSIKGDLIRKEAETILLDKKILKAPPVQRYLDWAYLGSSARYEPLCIRLLDVCQEDFRDGVFLACYRLNTPRIYRSLVEHFSEWIEIDGWGTATGELGALKHFLGKWDVTPGFCEHGILRDKLKALRGIEGVGVGF